MVLTLAMTLVGNSQQSIFLKWTERDTKLVLITFNDLNEFLLVLW
jgi:hypothetical protein